jgi:2-octaprenyl-6-methoxyphenol hydroxylase
MAHWKYDHQALVSVVRHERPHEHVAYEIFYTTGPFALLPMNDDSAGHRSAIVWSVPKEDAAGWLSLDDDDFAGEAEAAMGGFLGRIQMLAPRSSYPLGFHHAAQMTACRLALVGDAAHAIHPIAGQGLNLGFRDVAALAQVLVEGARIGLDLGDSTLLDRYQRWRSLDALSVAFATDTLTRIYGVRGKTASAVRRFGMELVGRISPVRDRLMSEARGTSGELPLLLRGLPI